jgi:hypothetical protein
MESHKLIAFEDSFLSDGPRSVCSCGWKSEEAPNMLRAADMLRDHALSFDALPHPLPADYEPEDAAVGGAA